MLSHALLVLVFFLQKKKKNENQSTFMQSYMIKK